MLFSLFKTDILYAQRLLSSANLYKDKLDGKYGKNTKAAEDEFENLYNQYAKKYGSFDMRSEGIIQTLLPQAQVAARHFMQLASHAPFTVKLISGTRNYAEQNILFNKRPKVTNARGGQSNHNFGIAWDVGIFVNGNYYTGKNKREEQAYINLSELVMPTLGNLLTWGGNWKNLVDRPHYEVTTNKSISQVRKLFEAGKPYI